MEARARVGRLVHRLRRQRRVRVRTDEQAAAAIGAAGDVLAPPDGERKGIFLVNGTRLRFYRAVAERIRADYVTVLIHFWAFHPERLREYQRIAPLVDAVVSPNAAYDRLLGFAPIYRSNGMDLVVDDTLFPLRGLARDIELVESTSVPWVLKRPLHWLAETRARLDRLGGGRAVYLTKREPGEQEDAQCHRDWARFREELARDGRIELRVRSSLQDVVDVLNRARYLFHPSTSEFAPRAAIEALYCGALVVAGPFGWAETVSVRPELRARVVEREHLTDLPEHETVDVRRWQTARGQREGLVDFLVEHGHDVNPAVETFSLFSSKRVSAGA
ncbi:MAG TPA: hypothetical protein VFB26_00315 [Gaiellaceae bacterium]|nr:hypothetical protein [Gaiellaceae bacterium]